MKDKTTLPLGEEILQIGYGRLGKPFYSYLTSVIGSSPDLIKSSQDKDINFKRYKYVFICTDDSSLDELIRSWFEYSKIIVHFSGSLYFENATGVHPVFSFPLAEEGSVDFEDIDFVIDKNLETEFLKKVFKKRVSINPKNKKQYHLHLSLMANYTQLLAHEISLSFDKYTKVDRKYFFKILKQSLDSVEKSQEKSFSGPWVRNERQLQNSEASKHENEVIRNLNASFNKLINVYKQKKEEEVR